MINWNGQKLSGQSNTLDLRFDICMICYDIGFDMHYDIKTVLECKIVVVIVSGCFYPQHTMCDHNKVIRNVLTLKNVLSICIMVSSHV